MQETINEILTNSLSKGLITSAQSDYVMSTLQEFLESHPDYTPQTSRERAAMPNDPEEEQLWSSIQPILDRAQGMG